MIWSLCRTQAGSAFGQPALRRLLSAPERASGCPKLRSASAHQQLGPRWPATPGVLSTRSRASAAWRGWPAQGQADAQGQASVRARVRPRARVRHGRRFSCQGRVRAAARAGVLAHLLLREQVEAVDQHLQVHLRLVRVKLRLGRAEHRSDRRACVRKRRLRVRKHRRRAPANKARSQQGLGHRGNPVLVWYCPL